MEVILLKEKEVVGSTDVVEKKRTKRDDSGEMVDKDRVAMSETRWDMSGRPICRLCGRAQDDMVNHLNLDHDVTVEKYQEDYPGWPIEGRSDVGKGESLSFKDRPTEMFSVHELFGFWWGGKGKDKKVQGYKEPGPMTPKVNKHYVFNPETTQVCLLGLYLKDRILMFGPTGTGKTSIWEQICARLNYNYVRINFDAGVTRADLVGQWVVRGHSMEFSYGILPSAMLLPGTVVCFDEWDSVSQECSFVLQRPLEDPSQLLIMENKAEVVTLHKDNLIVATANTAGMGDETGLYTGTRQQNYSQINRFSMTIEAKYLPAPDEEQILMNMYGSATEGRTEEESLQPLEAKAMVQAANAIREAHLRGELSVPLSTRDLVNWGEKYMIWGEPLKAAKYCFVNRLPVEDRDVVLGVVKRCSA